MTEREPESEPGAERAQESEPGPERGPVPPAAVGWLPRGAEELFGEGATAEDAYGLLTADVPADTWIAALTVARDELGCTYFDWLSAVDEPGTGFRVCAHVVALPAPGTGEPLRRLLVRTTVPHEAPSLPTATGVYAGAAWHERETHEMFGVDFPDHPHLAPLLLPDTFEGHPLRKDFVLAARVAKAWPGAKEPGESGHGGPKRRQMLPPGVPDPNEWGPLKGQLPPAPARPARSRAGSGARAGAGASAGSGAGATDRPRRTRSASAGSASQRTPKAPTEGPTPDAKATPEEAAPQGEAAPATSEPSPSRGEPRATAPGDAPWHQPTPPPTSGEGEAKGEAKGEGKGKGKEEGTPASTDESAVGEREGEED